LVIIEFVLLEAAFLISFIRLVRALGLTIAFLGLFDTITVRASPLSIWVAATDFRVVLLEASEAAEVISFIRFISTLSLTITVVGQFNAVSIVTLPFIFLASTLLVVIEWEVFEAAVLVTFVRLIFALGVAVAKVALEDAVTVSTLPLVVSTTAFLVIVEREFLEAALSITFIRSVKAVSLSVTYPGILDALAISTSPFVFWVAATDLGAIGGKLLEAAVFVTFIRLVFTLGFTIT